MKNKAYASPIISFFKAVIEEPFANLTSGVDAATDWNPDWDLPLNP